MVTSPNFLAKIGRSYPSGALQRAQAGDAALVSHGLRGKGAEANDAFTNAAARMGFGTPSVAEGADYQLVRWSYDYQLMYTLYRNQWIARKIVDTPAQDMVRAWPTIKSDLEPSDMAKLDRTIRDTQTKTKLLETLTWARLFGGAGALIVIDGHENRLDEPLDIDTVELGSYHGLIPFDRWVGIYPDGPISNDITKPLQFNLPERYRVQSIGGGSSFTVHASRILRFTGPSVPAPEYQAQMYWGISVLEIAYEAMKMRDNMLWNMLGLSFRANLLGFKSDALDQALSGASMNQNALVAFYQRLEMLNSLISNQNMTVFGEKGGLEQVQYAFGGCSDLLEQFRFEVSGASDIPEMRLFGHSPSGMGIKDDPAERLYEERIAVEQDVKMRPQLDVLYPVMCMSTLGFVPDDLDLDFPSIRVPGEDEKAALAKNVGDVVLAAFGAGLIGNELALQELKQSSMSTGIWTNITSEILEAAKKKDADAKEMQNAAGYLGAEGEEGEEKPQSAPELQQPKKPRAVDSKHRNIEFAGIPITIEHEAGERRQIRNERNELVYDRLLKAPYGFVQNSLSVDGDELDVIVGPAENAPFVWIIQMRDLGPDIEARQDEPKCCIGWQSESSAVRAFQDMYGPDWIDDIEEVPLSEFKARLAEADGRVMDELSEVGALDEFVESEHPRGTGEHGGEFVKGSGGGAASKSKTESNREQSAASGQRQSRHSMSPAPANRADWPEHIKTLKVPPAWTDVQISENPNADLLVVGKDSKGRRVPIYSKRFADENAQSKFKRVFELDKKFDGIQKQNAKAMASADQKTRENAHCANLIMAMGIRPGSDNDTKAKVKAYGATTLEGRHIVEEDGQVYVRFIGKEGVANNHRVPDPTLAKELLRRSKTAGDAGRLFSGVSGSSVLNYTHTLNGGSFKTKDFRTRLGTSEAKTRIAEIDPPTNEKDYKKKIMEVAKAVSQRLGNQPKMALQAYINPAVFARWKASAGI